MQRACFGSSCIKGRDILMCSMLVSARGFRNEIDSCVVRLFHVVSAHALKNEVFRLYI